MVLHSPGDTVAPIHKIAENLRRCRTIAAPPVFPIDGHLMAFRQVTANFATFMRGAAAVELETEAIVVRLGGMADALAAGPDPATPAGLVGYFQNVCEGRNRHHRMQRISGGRPGIRRMGRASGTAQQSLIKAAMMQD
jgi:exodeoxyribonuclease-5